MTRYIEQLSITQRQEPVVSTAVPQGDSGYFQRPEVSNSDLTWLKQYLANPEMIIEYVAAYRMGNLIDAMITEPHKVNYLTRACGADLFTEEEFKTAQRMKRSFMDDDVCKGLLQHSRGQVVFSGHVPVQYEGVEVQLPMRCKYDLWAQLLAWGGDIKSTTATTLKQFLAAIEYFDYDRQRVVYMKTSGARRDLLIGISKKNFKIFKVPIERGSPLWQSGERKLNELGFKWWTLF